jgi:hypothetical protein
MNDSSKPKYKQARVDVHVYRELRIASRLMGCQRHALLAQAIQNWIREQKERDPAFAAFFDQELQKLA